MLYVTTRSDTDAYTAQRALSASRGPDGGLFVPFRLPVIPWQTICGMEDMPFNQRLAEILNYLFNTRLSGYDLDLAMGRYGIRLKTLSRRIVSAECWHNTQGQFRRMVEILSGLIRQEPGMEPGEGDWIGVGVRIAVLFGIFPELIREGIVSREESVDIACVTGDFSAPMAAWYARAMGLPIGSIICCCNENASLWNFICHGSLRTDGVALRTIVPDADVAVSVGLERLIHATCGPAEALRFVEAMHRGITYRVDDGALSRLRKGLYVTVSSLKRIVLTIPAAYSTHKYLLSPDAALAYCGLQDYRSRTGSGRMALLMCDNSPMCSAEAVANAMGIEPDQVENYL